MYSVAAVSLHNTRYSVGATVRTFHSSFVQCFDRFQGFAILFAARYICQDAKKGIRWCEYTLSRRQSNV